MILSDVIMAILMDMYIIQYYQPRLECFIYILAHLRRLASKTHSASQFLDAIVNWLPPDSFSSEFPVSRNAFASHQLTLEPIWWWYSHPQPHNQNSWLIKRKLPLIKHWLCIKLLAKQANIRAQTKPAHQQLRTNCGWISVSAWVWAQVQIFVWVRNELEAQAESKM